ncbi:MAG: hypothetical protein KKF44_04420 [Nanoarchaeota archaeon]|nr:hypothetical protein [Nanoarchaeota archaeon]
MQSSDAFNGKRKKNISFGDEREWWDISTKPIERIIPLLNKGLISKVLFYLLILALLLINFHKLFITILSIIFVSYVRFKRTKHGIDMEVEPSYLLAISITLAFGLEYGLAFVIIPQIATSFTGVNIGTVVNILNKAVVICATYFYWMAFHNKEFMILFATILVLTTDIAGYFVRKHFGQPILQIIQVLATNTIIRLCYFSIFLDFIVNIISRF